MTDWATIFTTAALTTSGTGGVALLTHYLTAKRDWSSQQDRHARYLAVRLVSVLDEFITGCSEVVSDNGEPNADGYALATVKSPALVLPSDVEWKAVEPSIMYRAMALPNQVESANRAISFTMSMIAMPPDYDEYFEERKYRFGKLGLQALGLVEDMRAMFDIPPYDFGAPGWHPRPHFEQVTVSIDEARERGAKAAEAMIAAAAGKAEGRGAAQAQGTAIVVP